MALTVPSLSPAIIVKEIDLTGVAPNVETSLAGFVGDFMWGPVDVPTRVENEGQLVEKFGSPTASKAVDFLSATQFLRYSGNLIVNRQIDNVGVSLGDSAFNAVSGSTTGVVVTNLDNYEQQEATLGVADTYGTWIAKYPGSLGNSLSVHMFSPGVASGYNLGTEDSVASRFESWQFENEFDAYPLTSDWAAGQAGDNTRDEVHIAVVDSDGKISGTKGTVLETFPFLSVAEGAKTLDGGDNYFANVINSASNYVWFGGFDSVNTMYGSNWGTPPDGTAKDYGSSTGSTDVSPLASGTDTQALDTGAYNRAFDNFENPETVDVQILIAPGMSTTNDHVTVVEDLVGIAQGIRKDCVVCASPARDDVVNNNNPVTSTLETTNQFTASNYLIVDNNYLRVFDKYNEQYVYVPAASTVAGMLAATDANYGPWWSPAGEKRGQVLGASGIAYSPTKAERDSLYKAGVNSIVQFAGRGTLLFGDKTKQSRPSAFDRINVRRLFLAIEKSISIAARNFMFEFNDEFTRAEFVGVVEPLLREIQARRGITDFYVQCDERNNTPEVVDRNEMVASIFIKPARSINFITLNFVAVRTGVQFEEVVGRV